MATGWTRRDGAFYLRFNNHRLLVAEDHHGRWWWRATRTATDWVYGHESTMTAAISKAKQAAQ